MTPDERRKYLLSISEDASFLLPIEDWYDRIRLKRQILGMEQLKMNTATNDMVEEKTPSTYPIKPFNRTTTVIYRDFVND